jgi:hypothetical protein
VAEQDPAVPGPEGGPADSPQTEEELRARLEEEMKKVRVEDFLLQSISGLLNLTARRLAKEDERDLEQARIGIEAISAWGDLLPEEAAQQVAQAVAELKMLYARFAQGGEGGGEPGAGGEGEEPGEQAAQPAPEQPRPSPGQQRPGEPPPRLWTPGSG